MDEPEEGAPKPAPVRQPAAKREYGAALKPTPAILTQLETFGAALCSPEEIAAIFGNELHQLQRLFDTRKAWLAYQRGRARAMLRLRKAQLGMAAKSVPMATALGKVYLGQSEQREQDERPPNSNRGATERLKNRLLGIIAEGGAEESDPGDQ